MIALYVKTHETGLKYLGQTSKDPQTYTGSGKHWLRHIKKHGNNVTTEVLSRCNNMAELETCGLFFSKLFNVVESKEWANLMPERGDGFTGSHSEETKEKMRGPRAKRGPLSEEHKAVIRQKLLGRKTGPPSEETRQKISEATRGPRGPHKNPRKKRTA